MVCSENDSFPFCNMEAFFHSSPKTYFEIWEQWILFSTSSNQRPCLLTSVFNSKYSWGLDIIFQVIHFVILVDLYRIIPSPSERCSSLDLFWCLLSVLLPQGVVQNMRRATDQIEKNQLVRVYEFFCRQGENFAVVKSEELIFFKGRCCTAFVFGRGKVEFPLKEKEMRLSVNRVSGGKVSVWAKKSIYFEMSTKFGLYNTCFSCSQECNYLHLLEHKGWFITLFLNAEKMFSEQETNQPSKPRQVEILKDTVSATPLLATNKQCRTSFARRYFDSAAKCMMHEVRVWFLLIHDDQIVAVAE